MTEDEIKAAAACSRDGLAWARGATYFANDQGRFFKRGLARAIRTPVMSPDDVFVSLNVIYYSYEEIKLRRPAYLDYEWKPRIPIPPLEQLAGAADE